MKVLVCGGRDFSNEELLIVELDAIMRKELYVTCLIHGAARGADSLAGKYAREHGIQEVICPANWGQFGKAAGYRRNKSMLDLSPNLVVAFPGGAGTANMIALAERQGVRVIQIGLKTGE